ncbi:plastin-3-like [Ciona intestinalis]
MANDQYESGIRQALANMSLGTDDVDTVVNAFITVDTNQNGCIEKEEVEDLFRESGLKLPKYKIRDLMKEADLDRNNTISPTEFARIYAQLTSEEYSRQFKTAITTKSNLKKSEISNASAEGTQHSYSEEECAAFNKWIKKNLEDDEDCKIRVKNMQANDFFKRMKDGIILCKMVNLSQPDTIDERTINKKNLNIYREQENINLALNSASAIGCNIVNIGAEDIVQKKEHLILGLLWQVIRIGLFRKIDLIHNPGISALLLEGETLDDLRAMSPEDLLLRWMNYHLQQSDKYKEATGGKVITNFSGDIKDSIAYTCLLERIQPIDEETQQYELSPPICAKIEAKSNTARAESMLEDAERMDCREFVTAKDITKGNAKLNMAFVANLFNTHPALTARDMEEIEEEDREVKTYRNWMNSLGVSPRVNKFTRDLTSGLVLFQLYEQVKPGCVDWSKVDKKCKGRFQKLQNLQYAVEVAKQLGFVIVGIEGNDILAENETLVLAVVWQIMRAYTFKILETLSEDGKPVKEQIIIDWVNQKLRDSGKESQISNFKDSEIKKSIVVIDLIDAIVPNSIRYEVVTAGETEEDQYSNAKYAVSMARKIGARIYALPDDLVEGNAKMVATIFACLMGRGMKEVE